MSTIGRVQSTRNPRGSVRYGQSATRSRAGQSVGPAARECWLSAPRDLLQLQRTSGNAAVVQLLREQTARDSGSLVVQRLKTRRLYPGYTFSDEGGSRASAGQQV